MDVDFSLIKEDFQIPINAEWRGLNATIRDDVLIVRKPYENTLDDIDALAIKFIIDINTAYPELENTTSIFEVAYYYDVNKKAYFSAPISLKLMSFISNKNISLKIIGYPCED